ncbi:MAG: hypothetical protein ACRC8S_08765 [Fimbriiglobus sp.]
MDGVFWHDDMGFVVDPQKMPASFPDAVKIEVIDFAERLEASGKLPPLGPAPVASWLLARLFQLTRDRLGFDTNERIRNDGGGYYLNFVAFTRKLKPVAFFMLHGQSKSVRLWGTCPSEISPEAVLLAFSESLLENPTDLMVCKVTTIDTDPPNLHVKRTGKPIVFGWDGTGFLGFRKKA